MTSPGCKKKYSLMTSLHEYFSMLPEGTNAPLLFVSKDVSSSSDLVSVAGTNLHKDNMFPPFS
jgi:hypothetical protein